MLTSKVLAELLGDTPLCEVSEIAKKTTDRGGQQFSAENNVANYAKLLPDDRLTSSLTSQVSKHCESVAKPMPEPFLASSQSSQVGLADSIGQSEANEEADHFWRTFRARIDECDSLIHELCDLRRDDHRADLLAVRKRMAPHKLDSDIHYLKSEIAIERLKPQNQIDLDRSLTTRQAK